MKRQDFFFCMGAVALFLPFFLFSDLFRWYQEVGRAHPYILAFCKFSLLATAGESLGLRLQKGRYNQPGFGLLPRAVIWGLLGVWIAAAMKVYAAGVPRFLEGLGFAGVVASMNEGLCWLKVIGAFGISLFMNTTFAPVFMTCHKITDAHILKHGGKVNALVTPIEFGNLMEELNWKVQWGFVFKKTIPLFWIPAHTVTFLLPPEWQVLFAAFLGVALGVLLSVAAEKQRR